MISPSSPVLLPQLTVVKEFTLSTSRRAEWDTHRVSEDMRLPTEERAAKQVPFPVQLRQQGLHAELCVVWTVWIAALTAVLVA
jgi:hypothetical protein